MAKVRVRFIPAIVFIGVLFVAQRCCAAADDKEPEVSLKPEVEYTAGGLRDPFRSYLAPEELSQVPQETGVSEQPLPALAVEGIVWGGKFPQAIINHQVVRVGDEIEGVEILEISPDGVAVFYQNRKYNLSSPATTGSESLKPKPEGGEYEEQPPF